MPASLLAFALAAVLASEPVQSAEIIVPTNRPTIQAAVDAAAPGDTVKVLRGTYKEQIVISKQLTLKGVGVGRTVIQAPASLVPFGQNLAIGLPAAAIVRITDGARVWMSGFTLTGPIPCSIDARGILVVKDATLAVKDAHVTRMRPASASCPPDKATGRAIVVGLVPFVQIDGEPEGGSFGHATITNVLIDKYQLGGISILAVPPGPPSTATISKNIVLGGADIKVDGQVGINNTWAIVQITKNVVRGNVCTGTLCGDDPFNDFQSAGIGPPFLASEFTEISENFVSDNDVGIYSGGGPFVIKENLVLNSRLFGIAIQDGDGATERNTISGARIGIAVIAGSADATGTLTKDRISRTSVAQVKEVECCGFNATAIVK
jgi:nitrous oxidase accessory protein NosD